jgi:hypothetical protein
MAAGRTVCPLRGKMGTEPDFPFTFLFIITLIFSSINDHNVSINTYRSPFSP